MHLAFLLSIYKKEEPFIAVENVQFVVARQGRFVLIGEYAWSLGYSNISFLSRFTGCIFTTVASHGGKICVVLYAEQK